MDRVAITLSPNPVVWSSGELFDGFLIISIGKPTGYGSLTLLGTNRQHPNTVTAVIKSGILAHPLEVFPTTLLLPPGCRYYFTWFDSTGKQIYPSPPTLPTAVNITAVYTLTAPTLTSPSASTTAPSIETTMITP